MKHIKNNLKLLKHILLLALLQLPISIFGQGFTVDGVVESVQGEPLIGVTILVEGTTVGTVTDFDGKFVLGDIPAKSTLVISYVSYQTQKVVVDKDQSLVIKLVEDNVDLDEVVVVGYGAMKKSDLTGAVAVVDSEQLANKKTTNVAEALQSAVPGVSIRKGGGLAGDGVSVKIRGVSTYGSTEPLYIIDGFAGDISTVNPNDIKSINVMKDAAAAAIYGSVAANGVVIIETKGGNKGEIVVNIDSYVTGRVIANQLDLLDASEYVSVHKAMYEAAGKDLPAYVTSPGNANTNWQDEVFRNGFAHTHSMSIRGGGENVTFGISSNFEDERGVAIGNDYFANNSRIRVDAKKGIFDFSANMAFTKKKYTRPEYSLKEVYSISPLVEGEREDGSFGLTDDIAGLPHHENVLARQHYRSNKTDQENMLANFQVTANFTKWLSFTSRYSFSATNRRYNAHVAPHTANPKSPVLYAWTQDSRNYYEDQLNENIINMNFKNDKHSLNVMIGNSISMYHANYNEISVEGKKVVYEVVDGNLVTSELPAGYLDPFFDTIFAGNGGTYDGDGSRYQYNRASFFGRINYNFKDKYILQATLRRDGSSKFGAGSRWGMFPSVAAAWRIMEEDFFPETSFVSNLKLRASWGSLGNENALGYYDYLANIKTSNTSWYGGVQGSLPWSSAFSNELTNLNLRWETTKSTNVGLDFGFFNNRLSGTIDYFHKATDNMLIEKNVPLSSGVENPIVNVGSISNSGVEFAINWADRVGDFDYNIGFNLASLKNKVTKLANDGQELFGDGLADAGNAHKVNRTIVGETIASYYLYKTDGIFQSDKEASDYKNKDGHTYQPNAKAGDIKFVDINKDGVIDDRDKEFMGNGFPSFEANLNLSLGYKGLDLMAVIGSGWGFELYNGNRFYYEGMASGSNFMATTLEAWRPDNTNTEIPRAVLGDPNGNTRESDRFLEDGDYIRLRQLQVGYSFPSKLTKAMHIQKLRIYFSADNLLTWTKYSGIDPEFAYSSYSSSQSLLTTGMDNEIFPFTRSFIGGLQLTF